MKLFQTLTLCAAFTFAALTTSHGAVIAGTDNMDGSWSVAGLTFTPDFGTLPTFFLRGTAPTGIAHNVGSADFRRGADLVTLNPAVHLDYFFNANSPFSNGIVAGSDNWLVMSAESFEFDWDTALQLYVDGADPNNIYILGLWHDDTLTGENILAGITDLNELAIPAVDVVSLQRAFRVHHVIPKLATTTIHGSHHRLLLDQPLGENGWHVWTTGDYARFNEVDADQFIGEVGVSTDFDVENFRLGLSAGHTNLDQDTAFGGGSKIQGEFLVVDANYQLPDSPLILSSLLYVGQYDADTSRGYALGGAKSVGSTDVTSVAARLRLDWKNFYQSGDFSLTPRVSYTYINSEADAYTETGGATPASYDKQSSKDHELRLGLDADYDFSEKTKLRGILEAVYRENDDEALIGSAGAVSFNLPSDDLNDTWARVGVEMIHQFTPDLSLNVSVFGSTEGDDPTLSSAVGLNFSF